MRRRQWLAWIAPILAVAALVHMGILYEIPRVIMARTLARMGPPNTLLLLGRPDPASRVVVRPSPDLLYSICPFDLSAGPLRIEAHVPHSSYWSIAGYDDATNNFFVRDDQQILGERVEIIAMRPGMALPTLGTTSDRVIVMASSARGVFVFRLLIDDETQLDALEALRRDATCEPTSPNRSSSAVLLSGSE